MSTLGDALKALKDVVLLQERMRVLQTDMAELTRNVDGLSEYALSIDKRVIRIETMIEMSAVRAQQPPAIEG